MAEIDQQFGVVENPGAYYAQDYSLNKLNILTSSGQTFEMKKLLVELSYYEDIYSFCVSGYVTLHDAQGFIERLNFSGNEFLELNFGKIKNGVNSTDKIYRIYKVGDRKPSGNMNSETYTLYFCSEELLLSEQNKISKSFTGQKISTMVSNILTDKLSVDTQKIEVIEETTGLYDFVVPNLKPFEAISWLSIYARPNMSGAIGADMLFFETVNGYNYRSLQSMFSDDVYATYKYQQKNLGDERQSFQEKATTILDYEFVKTYDMINEIKSGTFANRLISIDPLTRSYKVTDFDYKKYKNEAITLEDGAVSNELKNRLGKTQTQSYNSVLKVATSNAGQQDSKYLKQTPGAVAKNVAIETYVPNRTAQIALANYIVVKASIPGDPGITAGRTINFNLLSLKPTDSKKELDKRYSGKYLVTAVRHIIQPTAYQTILEISKDSVATDYSSINNESTTFQQAVRE